MTGAFLSVPTIMKPHPWVVLHVFVLAALLLTLNADGEDSKCETVIKVQRHTFYEAFIGRRFTINCTLSFCNSSPPTVSWYKIGKTAVAVPVDVSNENHFKTVWTPTTKNEGNSSLVFIHIVSSDAGQYQCHSGGSVSHNINVSVYDKTEWTTAAWNNDTSFTTSDPENTDVLLYVYSSAGIVVFVVIVIIVSVISMRGCKAKSKQETHTDNQYMEIPMAERASPQTSPRGSPMAPLPRRSTRRKPQEEQPSELKSPGDEQHVYGRVREDRQRQGNVEEQEGSSVVYAALNHQLPPRAAARAPRLQAEAECSEYAAIRVS